MSEFTKNFSKKHVLTPFTSRNCFVILRLRRLVMSEIKRLFGQKLKFYRKARNITQAELAERINLNVRQISRMEAGENFASPETLEKLSIALGIKVADFFNFNINRNRYTTGNHDKIICYKARIQGCLTKFYSQSTKENFSLKDFSPEIKNKYFSDLSKTHRHTVVIEILENNKIKNEVIYFPNGSMKLVDTEKQIVKERNLDNIIKEIISLSDNETMMKFLNTIICACKTKSETKRLKTIIKSLNILNDMKN